MTGERRILVFDVNETLLDLAALRQPFADAFGSPHAMQSWFSTLLQYSNIATLTRQYRPFGELGLAAVETTARAYGVTLGRTESLALVGRMTELPPHPEVKAGLVRLKEAGFRLVTLTNSSPSAAEAQLEYSGLRAFFERVFTVEAVRLFKPHHRTYESVAGELEVTTSDLRMVAAHGWDIAGAMAAGCAGAFVARTGKWLYPLAPPPDVIGPDLGVVAEVILRLDQPR